MIPVRRPGQLRGGKEQALVTHGRPCSLIFERRGTYILDQMRWLRPSRTLLFIILAFWTTLGLHAFSMGVSGTGTVTMSAGQGFGPKLQYGGGGAIEFLFPLLAWLRLDASLDLYTVSPSDATGGFLYRGYSGAATAIVAQAVTTIASGSAVGVLRIAGGLGFAAALPTYWYTTLAFFYLEPRAQFLLEWEPAALSRFDFQLSVPVRAQLRRDMSYSLSSGVGVGVLYRLDQKK
jgi:hypothetical protein